MDAYEASVEEAKQIINLYLEPLSNKVNNSWLLFTLAKVMEKKSSPLHLTKEFSQYKNLDIVSLAALRPTLDENKQKELDEYIKNNISDLYDALIIELNFSCHIFDRPLFKRLANNFLSKSSNESDEYVCSLLKSMYQNKEYIQYHDLIESMKSKKKVLAFFLDPIANVNEMEFYWILWLDDIQIRSLLNVDGVMQKIDIFCIRTYERTGKQIKKRIWKALIAPNN